MRNDYYFDDLDIENFFIEDASISGNVPTRAGLIDTRPENVKQQTAPRVDLMMKPVSFYEDPYNADGKLKEKLKKFVQSDKGKKILKLAIAGGIAIAFGPQIIAALGPVLPAMKTALTKQGLKAKGPGDIIKKFTNTQLKMADGDKKDPKKIVTAILGYFKAAKERRKAGLASPLDQAVLNVADTTIQKISDGTLSVERAIEGEGADETTLGRTKQTTETSTEKKGGIDMKIILIALVAVFFLTKK